MAQKVNIIIDQGTTFNTSFVVNDTEGHPLDFTFYTGRSQARKHYTSLTSYPFEVALTGSGEVILSMDKETTGSMAAGRYVYDVEVVNINNGSVSRIAEGIVTITPESTR